MRDVIYKELLKPKENIKEDCYQCLNQTLKEKRMLYKQRHNKVILLHDDAWLHFAKPVKTIWKHLNGKFYPTHCIYRI